MSKEEIKSAINELLDKTDEQVLNEVLNYLKSIQDKPTRAVQLSQNLRTILDEDKALLQRLAN